MTLNGNPDEANGYNSVIKNGEVADADLVKAVFSPIGSVTSWLKTFGTADSGTTDGTTTSKLVDSTQTDFLTTVSIGMIVHNTTDDTFANVTAIDSDTILSIDSDIMVSGEVYIIYKTPQLPDGWVECDGSVLSDSDSPYDGETIPNLNTTTSYYSLPGTAFHAKNPDVDNLQYNSANEGDVELSASISTGTLIAPVNLPHGAVVTSARVVGADSGNVWSLMKTDSTMATANMNSEDTTISSSTINNTFLQENAYHFKVSGMAVGDSVSFATITYTTTSNFIMRVK